MTLRVGNVSFKLITLIYIVYGFTLTTLTSALKITSTTPKEQTSNRKREAGSIKQGYQPLEKQYVHLRSPLCVMEGNLSMGTTCKHQCKQCRNNVNIDETQSRE
jgi:hypothetical protein